MGKSLDNALLNLELKGEYERAGERLGFGMEELLEAERDAGLGNGGLGRLASCYMDSLSTMDIPAWGYGLRYQYGIFQQLIDDSGAQLEVPDPWLDHSNPWEIPRLDTSVEIRFYGKAHKNADGLSGKWEGGMEVLAVPYDLPIPGYDTDNTNNIRLWSSKPKRAFDLSSFNAGDYDGAVAAAEEAENITRVLYPNDNFQKGKELRLKQQYFWVAASISDIIRRFKKIGASWDEFPEFNAIQLNDTHPTLAIVELMRVLVDDENLEWDEAWGIVQRTFGYTNHTVLPEALEKWPVPMLDHILPRHLQIIFDVNLFFLQQVEKKYPGERERLSRMSLIEEGNPQQVRMAYLAIVGSHCVNGVAELHSRLVKDMMKDFVDFYGRDKFTNVTNGVTPRRWLLQCNPGLASLITKTLGSGKWLKDLSLLKGIEKYATDKAFQKQFEKIKLENKEKLAAYIERTLNVKVNREALFDIQVKRIHEYKRQSMNILGCIYRYLELKKMNPKDLKDVAPRVSIFAGKAAPGYYIAKLTIKLINAVSKVIAADKQISEVFKVIFLPDYSVSLAELLIPASDISEHISTAGTEASGTSNMKFALNGGLILGTVDGANIEIAEEVGMENVYFFGVLADAVADLRHTNYYSGLNLVPELQAALDAIREGMFGPPDVFDPFVNSIYDGKDYYLLNSDFQSYLEAQKMIDADFVNKPVWNEKGIRTVAKMGKFSSDRSVMDYCESIWNVDAQPLPKI
ncbi:glycosyltransferase family 35 protein [Atractiella rhizophila]|nr:glycosyltransferase family 35 protein [Atractiella rhizophila]